MGMNGDRVERLLRDVLRAAGSETDNGDVPEGFGWVGCCARLRAHGVSSTTEPVAASHRP
jgi:hypothetical protein